MHTIDDLRKGKVYIDNSVRNDIKLEEILKAAFPTDTSRIVKGYEFYGKNTCAIGEWEVFTSRSNLLSDTGKKTAKTILLAEFWENNFGVFKVPAKWCIKCNDKSVTDYFDTIGSRGWSVEKGAMVGYLHYPVGRSAYEGSIRTGYMEITLEQFQKHILKKDDMEQKTTRKKLFSILDKNDCKEFNDYIRTILKENGDKKDTEAIVISPTYLKMLDSRGSAVQKTLVKSIGISLAKENTLDTIRGTFPLFGANGLIQVRSGGNLQNKSFFLNNNYTWKIVPDDTGEIVLVPTKKK